MLFHLSLLLQLSPYASFLLKKRAGSVAPLRWSGKFFPDEKKFKKDTTPAVSIEADLDTKEEEDKDMAPKVDNFKGSLET